MTVRDPSMTSSEAPRVGPDRRPWRGPATAACCLWITALCAGGACSQGVNQGARAPKIVSTTDELIAAIAGAHPGDTIRAKPGVYVGASIAHANFKDAVKVTSLDPSHPAVLSGLKIGASSGLKFSQIELLSESSTDPIYSYRVQDSDDIVFDDIIAHGNRDVPPSQQKAGFYITTSSNIRISNSRFDHLGAGVAATKSDHIDIVRNLFVQMSKGGIELGGVGFVNIVDNVFTDFQVGRGIHPDGIQIFTATMPMPSHDISVIGNLIYRGRGNAIQGIFIQDEGTMSPFQNLTVANNAVLGGMWDSIYIKHAVGPLVIKDNVTASWPGIDMEGSGNAEAVKTKPSIVGFTAYFWLRGDMSGAVMSISGNQAQVYLGNAGRIAPPPGNTVIGGVTDDGKGLLKTWMTGHPQLLPLLAAANLP